MQHQLFLETHRVSEAACRVDHWDGAVAQRDQLRQATRLKERRDEDDVTRSVDPADDIDSSE
jgi:hypothetical protein